MVRSSVMESNWLDGMLALSKTVRFGFEQILVLHCYRSNSASLGAKARTTATISDWCRSFGKSIVSANNQFNRVEQLIRRRGFDDPARRTGGFGLHPSRLLLFGGQERNWNKFVGGKFADFRDQLNAVHSGHVEVGNQQVDLDASIELAQCNFGIGSLLDRVAGFAQNA